MNRFFLTCTGLILSFNVLAETTFNGHKIVIYNQSGQDIWYAIKSGASLRYGIKNGEFDLYTTKGGDDIKATIYSGSCDSANTGKICRSPKTQFNCVDNRLYNADLIEKIIVDAVDHCSVVCSNGSDCVVR